MKIEHQMEMHKLYANYHMTRAITGNYKRSIGKVERADGYILTDEDVLERTMSIVKSHIQLYTECAENIVSEEINEKI